MFKTISKYKYLFLAAVVLPFMMLLSFMTGRYSVISASDEDSVTVLSSGELVEKISNGDEFILYIHRSSCKICAIVSDSLEAFTGKGLPLYSFNMESLMGTPEYDKMKNLLGFTYMPCFKHIKDGEEKAHLNNPLQDTYFDTEYGPDRDMYRMQMEERVTAFIKGAAGLGKPVSETPQSGVIVGVPVAPPAE